MTATEDGTRPFDLPRAALEGEADGEPALLGLVGSPGSHPRAVVDR